MKKFYVLLMLTFIGLFATTTFTSCSDDDDDVEIQDTRIVGSWQDDNTYDGIWVWTFNKNGKGSCHVTDGDESYTFTFTFKYDGTNLIISGKEDGEVYTDTYKVVVVDNEHVQLYSDGHLDTTLTRVK